MRRLTIIRPSFISFLLIVLITFTAIPDDHTGKWEYIKTIDPFFGSVNALELTTSDNSNDEGLLLNFCNGGLFLQAKYGYLDSQLTRVKVDDKVFAVEWASDRYNDDVIYLVDYGHTIRDLLSGDLLIVEVEELDEFTASESWRSVYSFPTTGWKAAVQENCD